MKTTTSPSRGIARSNASNLANVCPNCGSLRVYRRTRAASKATKYYCAACESRFPQTVSGIPKLRRNPASYNMPKYLKPSGAFLMSFDQEPEQCPICHYAGEPIREYRATEKLISCPRCGALIYRAPFLLAAFQTSRGVVLNV